MIEIHVAFLVPDALALFVETIARTRSVGQIPGGVFRGTLATVKPTISIRKFALKSA